MLALALVVGVYTFWMFLGTAFLSAFHFSRHTVRNLLLAPSIGAALTLLPVFWLNRAGLPVSSIARPVTFALLAGAVVLSKWRGRRFPWKSFAPFALLLALACLLTLRPMLQFGFNWISYGNDDMGNYVLASERLFDHGFFDQPSPDKFVSGRDAAPYYWFMHVYFGSRCGSEMLLAWLRGVCGGAKTALELFMPLTGAFFLSLISAASGFAYRFASSRKTALATCFLLSCSALTTLGTLYQLIAQVFGLSLLAAACAILMRPIDRLRMKRLAPYSVIAAVVLAAVAISYPEVLPFLIAPLAIYAFLRARATRKWSVVIAGYASVLTVFLVLINSYVRPMADFMLYQILSRGARKEILFPYYLLPSGLGYLWGLLPINSQGPDSLLSVNIALGAILAALAIVAGVSQLRRGDPVALVTSVMMLVAALLFATRSDFALFKLAMYIQPFLLATIAGAWMRFAPRHPEPLLLLALCGIYSQQIYELRSGGDLSGHGGGLVEVPGFSAPGAIERLIQQRAQSCSVIVSDTDSSSAAKIQSDILRGQTLIFVDRDMFTNIVALAVPNKIGDALHRWGSTFADPVEESSASSLVRFYRETYSVKFFPAPVGDRFLVPRAEPRVGHDANVCVLLTGGGGTILNRFDGDRPAAMTLARADSIRNRLVYIASDRGRTSSDPFVTELSLHASESDLLFRGSAMAALGRMTLFEIWNPDPRGYLVLNFTESYMDNGDNSLPAAIAYGSQPQPQPLGMIGRGSARMFIPLEPREIEKRYYVALDLNRDPIHFARHPTGLMRVYGREIPADPRLLVGFARDISYISCEKRDALSPPSFVAKFPSDLANPALEYSGIYEDGWIAEESFLTLAQTASAKLRVAGMVPWANRIRILLDEEPVFENDVERGSFDWRIEAKPRPGARRIRIEFQSALPLSAGDHRIASALLRYVGFEQR